jgi:cytochrome c5
VKPRGAVKVEPRRRTKAADGRRREGGRHGGRREGGRRRRAGDTAGDAKAPDAKAPDAKTTPAKTDQEADGDEGAAIDGKPLYDAKCKSCHAIDGKGTEAMKKNNIPDLSDKAWQGAQQGEGDRRGDEGHRRHADEGVQGQAQARGDRGDRGVRQEAQVI